MSNDLDKMFLSLCAPSAWAEACIKLKYKRWLAKVKALETKGYFCFYDTDNTHVMVHKDTPREPINLSYLDTKKQIGPHKGDLVYEDGVGGVVIYLREDDVGIKWFDDPIADERSKDQFTTYSSKGGRTKWEI